MKKLFLLFALVLTVGMNAWAGDYVAYDYLNDVVCTTDQAYTRIYKEPTLEDPSFAIFMFIKDSGNGKRCVTWGGYENKDANILPKILIDGVDFAQPGWEMCWLNTDPDRNVDDWWDTKNDKASIYTKEINGVTWTLRFNDVQRYDSRYFFVKMYFCPSEIEGGSKHTITVKGRLTEYVGENTPSTTNYLDVERDFVFDMPKLITSDPIVVKENANENALSFYGNLAAGAVKSTYFGVYVNDGTVNGFVPYDQLDGKQELAYATTFSNIKYTIPEEYKDKALRVQMHRDFSGLLGSKVSVCHYYNYHDWLYAEINTVHHEAVEPTYETVGNVEYWEDRTTVKYYSDGACTKELSPAQRLTYAKFITNPVTANNRFTLKEDATYGDVQFNWAAETTYDASDTGTRSVEFTVYGTDVANARLKWTKNCNDARYGKFTITVYVNGEQKYSVNQNNDESLGGYFAVPLQGLNSYDVVKFEVNKTELAHWAGPPMIAACLEYTSSDGGEREVIYHEAVEPTYKTTGNIEYWEDEAVKKLFSDAECINEVEPEQVLTYAKFITNPVTANNGFTLKDATYKGVPFNWAAETIYHNSDKDKNHMESGERHVEFTVYGTDVANARLKWTKNCGNSGYGECTITISVNNTTVHTVNQGNLQGLFAVPLEGLKQGDIVRFSVNLYNPQWKGDPMIAACLEYTSSNGGWNEAIIHHDAVEPTYDTIGNIEYWEDGSTGKYYSDAACTQELNPIQIDTYKKLISDPVTANSGLTLRDITYEGMQFNWAAVTNYNMWATGTRSVEFTVYGKDVDNARVKWTKNYDYEGYGRFTISIYVNGVSVYSVNQDNGEFLGGLFTVPLQDLKTGDVVKFEIKKPQEARLVDANPTIIACLEYTSSNGGFNPEIIITADDNWKNKGDDDPELTWKVTKGELKEGTELTIKIWREEGEDAGLYPIHVSQEGTNPNDNIAFVDGVFRIIDAIHHDVSEPMYETVGYSQECWEDRTTGKYYSDVAFTQELNPAQVITYAKFISNPVTANNGFTLTEDATYEDVKFNWAAETTYPYGTTGTRSVEFTVFGTDVANARVKWTKNYNAAGYGSFIITVYVNGTKEYSINQGDNALGGLSAIPLPDLKSGDKVKFEVNKSKEASWGDAKPTITACLEYTSSNGGAGVILTADDKLKNKGDDEPELTWQITGGSLAEGDILTGIKIWREKGEEIGSYTIHVSQEEGANPKYNITFVEGTFRISDIIHHEAVEPKYETVGNVEYWEDRTTGKYYSDAACTKELTDMQIVRYKKLISDPVTANNGFTLKDVTYSGIQFDWAAETTYTEFISTISYVEFTVFGTDVDNARVKWTKTISDARYGIFNITVYVNGKQVYRIQNYGGADLFAVPLQGLKTGDIVRFEVQETSRQWKGSPTIAACLEYTSSNGGEGMLITANQDPGHTENYYSTFWSSTAAYQVPEGVTAYTGKVEDSTSEPNTSVLKLTAIEDGIIPASQGVILRLTTEDNSATKQQIALAKTTATGTWSGTNALTGTDEATTLGANQYALSLGQHGVGFYLWEGKEIGAHKAYLTLNASGSAKAFIFQFDDDPTGIEEASPISSPEGKDLMYDLNGVRVNDSYKGIVIKNGKKIYQK